MKPAVLRAVCALLFSILSFTNASAQNQANYNLLWRISGKGMKKPSYLFGTMHVRDARAFRFSDSVMTSIVKCDGFALEVHPDTIVQQMFTELGKKDSSRNLRKLLSPADYERMAKRFKEQNGYEMEHADPILVESSLTRPSKHTTDKVTFVDAYLMAIARTNLKPLYGLEKASDQINSLYGSGSDMKDRLLDLLDTEDGEIKESTNRMVQIYQTGNIDAIWAYVLESGMEYDSLIPRNQVMVASIIKQMAVQSLFSAVGVAHLPGPSGIINLLRKEGYKVEAVPATFTGVSDRYQVDYLKMKWLTHTDADKGYSVEMPGKPVRANMFSSLNTQIYADLGNDVFYGVFAFPKGSAAHPVKADVVINQLLENFKETGKNQVISRKAGSINGVPCTDVVLKTGSGVMRMNLVVKNNMLYCMYIGNDERSIYQPYANRFFNSFKCFPAAPQVPATWISYSHPVAAFKVQLPLTPSPMEKEAPNSITKNGAPIQLHLMMATDTINGMNYLMRYHDYPEGSYLAHKQTLFNSLEAEFKDKGTLIGKTKTIWKDKTEGRELKVMLLNKYFATLQFYARGNRLYMLMRQNLSEGVKEDTEDAFFNSFTFLPYQEGAAYNYQPEGEHFTLQMPAKPLIKKDTADNKSYITNTVMCFATNPNSAGVFQFEHSRIGPYCRVVSIDSLYSQTVNNVLGDTDSLIKKDTVIIAGKKGLSFIAQTQGTTDRVRSAILIDNGTIFYWSTRAANEELESPTSNTFFNSLQLSATNMPPVDITTSKAERIKNDLLSADTTVRKAAMAAVNYYDFDRTELPIIYQMLQHSYPDDSLGYTSTRNHLIRLLKTVNDEQSGSKLVALYADGTDETRAAILNTLPKADAKNGYSRYFELLTAANIKPKNTYQMFSPLTDSLPVFAANFKRLLPLAKQLDYRTNLIRLANYLYSDDSLKMHQPMVKAAFAELTAYAQDDLKHYLNDNDTTQNAPVYPIYNYLELMQAIKGQSLTPGFTAAVMKQGDKTNLWVDAAIARIYNHLPIAPAAQTRLLDSLNTRYEMLNAYYNEKQMHLVPAKYTRTDEFARLCLYKYICDEQDENYPDKLRLLGNVMVKGKTYYAFKYKLQTDEGEAVKTYIGISGPYVQGKTAVNFKSYQSYTNYDVLKSNWQQQAKKLIPALQELNRN